MRFLYLSPKSLSRPSIEDLTGFSYIYYPDSLSNVLLSQAYVLENGSHCGTVWREPTFQALRSGEEPLTDWVQFSS